MRTGDWRAGTGPRGWPLSGHTRGVRTSPEPSPGRVLTNEHRRRSVQSEPGTGRTPTGSTRGVRPTEHRRRTLSVPTGEGATMGFGAPKPAMLGWGTYKPQDMVAAQEVCANDGGDLSTASGHGAVSRIAVFGRGTDSRSRLENPVHLPRPGSFSEVARSLLLLSFDSSGVHGAAQCSPEFPQPHAVVHRFTT